ncbi:TPA: hypothetical protein ACH3X2_014148 [Trebouxia sp. C0005]
MPSPAPLGYLLAISHNSAARLSSHAPSPVCRDLMAAAVIIEQGTAHKYGAVSGRCACAELAGMYNRHGHRSPAHQQWCALMSLSGALVRSLGRDDRLDKGIVTLLVVAQERMLAVLTPPGFAQQPLTLALLQVGSLLHSCQTIGHSAAICCSILWVCHDEHMPRRWCSALLLRVSCSGHCCAAPRCAVSTTKCALLMQEVEKVLFLASSVPHVKGQWQMATQGPSQGPGPGSMGGPLATRQAG